MNFNITFGCDNAAFEGDNLKHEIGGILRDVAMRIEQGRIDGHVLDSNGNSVGTFAIVGRATAIKRATRKAKR